MVAGGLKKQRLHQSALCGVFVLMLFSLVACGGKSGGSSTVNYTVTISASSGSIVHTAQIAVAVQ
jgi:hypothetical protein